MSEINFTTTPHIQIPLRISPELSERFNYISSYTKIPKSTLGRLALNSLLSDIEQRGISRVLDDMESV
jgi:predicted DNA-binding protein